MSDESDDDIEVEFAGSGVVEIDLSDGGADTRPDPRRDENGMEPTPSGPSTDPSPDESTHPRGTFVFPAHDPEFLQLIELRGNNGAQRDVETVYLLAGDSYTTPARLIALDDPAIYVDMSPNSVKTKLQRIGEQLALVYEGRPDPKLIAYAHTHPNGATRPSRKDRLASGSARELLASRFDDFEFFNIIHALGSEANVPGEKRRKPREVEGGVWWWGERRRHELAIYDVDYRPRKVVLT